MKRFVRVTIAAMALAACLCMAGCKASSTAQNGRNNQTGNPQGQAPAQMSGTMGVITEVSSDSITIAVMPQGDMQQGGDRKPSGSGKPDGTAKPMPTGSDTQGAKPDSSPPAAPSGTRDTSSWEKKTYQIDSSTKIAKMEGSGGSQSAALTAADLKAGDSVNITERSGQTGTADQITVMDGMGGFQGGQGPGGPGDGKGAGAPADTATTKA